MKILALDTSSKVTTVSVVENTTVLAEIYANTKLTHSQTLMPMLESLLSSSQIKIDDIDCYAVSVGPGSFTGLRIGIGAIKGLAYGKNKPCIGVSTLEGLAYNLIGYDGIICAVMDARCNQVYTATFESQNAKITRITKDEAISIDELYKNLILHKKNIFFVGDGAVLCYNILKEKLGNLFLPNEALILNRASSVGLIAADLFLKGQAVSSAELMPVYLRLPQAQRELIMKKNIRKGESD